MELFGLIIILVFLLYIWVRKQEHRPRSSYPKPSYTEAPPRPIPVRRSPEQLKTEATDLWVPANQKVTISQYVISGGLIYVGQGLGAVGSPYQSEPALINPKLPINRSNPGDEETMPYWPSYSEVSPKARAVYLEWLSNGRKDPNTNIGYIFLFFYGLERRVLADTKTSEQARREVPSIIAEVERLLNIYGENGSFLNYATGFLGLAHGLFGGNDIPASPPVCSYRGMYSLSFKKGLARFALEGIPLPAEWAQSWLENHPEIWLRTPAQRCRDEFSALFKKRYQEKYNEGILLKPNKTPIKTEYIPASRTFSGTFKVDIKDLPDLTVLSQPVKQFYSIAESCIDDLDPYSRYLGRNPDAKESLPALALLPPDILREASGESFQAFKGWLRKTFDGGESKTIEVRDLLCHWPLKDPGKIAKTDAVALAQFLGKLGYGIEPDVRFGGPKLDPEGKAVLFLMKDYATVAATKAYGAGTTILHLATTVSSADGTISESEERHLKQHLDSILDLTGPERQRLAIHLQWLLASPPGLAGLKKQLSNLSEAQRKSVARFLIGVANADGRIDPGEILILKRIYDLLQMDADLLYSDIHNFQTGPAETPVTIRPGDSQNSGYKIPSPPQDKPQGVPDAIYLNMSAIEKTLQETHEVQSILADIFRGEDVEEIPKEIAVLSSNRSIAQDTLAGLDPDHTLLVKRLAQRLQWTRAEFEVLCAEFSLLPDGAIEIINEATFEHFNEPLLEDGDPLEVNMGVIKEMVQ